MGFIYKVTNTVNGKIYVGQTRRTIAARWKQHIYNAHHPSKEYDTLIGAVCRGDRQYAYGYRWSFNKVEHLNDPTPPKHFRKVVRISPDNGEGKIYPTIAAAAKDNNAATPNIIQACNNQKYTCKGFYWRYYDEQDQVS